VSLLSKLLRFCSFQVTSQRFQVTAAMVQFPQLNLLAPFLDRYDKRALRKASHANFEDSDPRSLQERLLAMTRRANEEQRLLGKRTARNAVIALEIVGERAKMADLLQEKVDLERLLAWN
jgi:hypothetical protein